MTWLTVTEYLSQKFYGRHHDLVNRYGISVTKVYGRHHDLVNRYGISVTNHRGYVPLVVNTSRFFHHSCLFTGFVTRLIRLVEQDMNCLPFRSIWVHPPVISGVHVALSLVFYLVFYRSFFVLFSPSILAIVLSSSYYGFWLSLWYLQILLNPLFTALQKINQSLNWNILKFNSDSRNVQVAWYFPKDNKLTVFHDIY
jgi:hypothetical protein